MDKKNTVADVTSNMHQEIINKINSYVDNYKYDQFRFFPSKNSNGWEKYFEHRLRTSLQNSETINFFIENNGVPFLLGFRISKWDEEIFGYKLANCIISFLPETENSKITITTLLSHCVKTLFSKSVKFVNLRIHGDNLNAIHATEDVGFRYYENIVWPYTESKHIPIEGSKVSVHLMEDNELEKLQFIAQNFQYHRGHFYCDKKFDRTSINNLHIQWLYSYWQQKKPIIVINFEDEIAGYIVLRGIDVQFYEFFGYKVGQLSSMAIDPKFRGIGLGKNLIRGGINVLTEMGVDFIDTGLATKNLYSSASIRVADFRNYYEEVTFHLWL